MEQILLAQRFQELNNEHGVAMRFVMNDVRQRPCETRGQVQRVGHDTVDGFFVHVSQFDHRDTATEIMQAREHLQQRVIVR